MAARGIGISSETSAASSWSSCMPSPYSTSRSQSSFSSSTLICLIPGLTVLLGLSGLPLTLNTKYVGFRSLLFQARYLDLLDAPDDLILPI